jgi:RluA family pseudouridine synthase
VNLDFEFPMVPVIWRNDIAAVVVKPAGIATQAPAPHASLETCLRSQFADQLKNGYLAFPHRLDRPVSGLILVAFTKKAARLLGEQFEARRITKTYLALVYGSIQGDTATWSDYLRKVTDHARVEIVSPQDIPASPDAKLAELQMRVIARQQHRTLLELRPSTGRMHQLRVQTSARGHAIVGDSIYGNDQTRDELAEHEIALQASKLEFNDPATGRRISVEAPHAAWCQIGS